MGADLSNCFDLLRGKNKARALLPHEIQAAELCCRSEKGPHFCEAIVKIVNDALAAERKQFVAAIHQLPASMETPAGNGWNMARKTAIEIIEKAAVPPRDTPP